MSVAPFACLTCPSPAEPGSFSCAACASAGRRMSAQEPAVVPAPVLLVDLVDRPLVQLTCPSCGEPGPQYTDVEVVTCLHCHALVRVAECLTG